MSQTKRALEQYVYQRESCTPEQLAFARGYCFADWPEAPPCDCEVCAGSGPTIEKRLDRMRNASVGERSSVLHANAFALGKLATPANLVSLFSRLIEAARDAGLEKEEIRAIAVPAFQEGMRAARTVSYPEGK